MMIRWRAARQASQFFRAVLAVIVMFGLAAEAGASEPSSPAEAKLEPMACRDPKAAEIDHRHCFRLDVPENPAEPKGRRIQLDGFVVPAKTPTPVKAAVFILVGGPGGRATEGDADPFADLIPDHDFVIIDQRGTGETPDIRCQNAVDGEAIAPLLIDSWLIDTLKKCLSKYSGRVDVRQFTTANSAEDIDLARRALGYDKIDLFGSSYGTILAQAYIRLHGDHVRSATLQSPASPDAPVPQAFARHTDATLMAVLGLCLDDAACGKAFPNIRAEAEAVKARLWQGDLILTVNISDRISPGIAASAIRSELYSPDESAMVPAQIHALAQGDNQAFTDSVVRWRKGLETDMSSGLYLSITCTEAFPLNDVDALHRDEAGTLFGSFRTDQLAKACAVWPRGHDKAELHHLAAWDGPVLALVGELDPVTPPVYGQRIIAQFPNGRLVRLPNQMHDMTDQAFTTCAQPLIVAFIKSARASDLDTRCTEGLAFPEFVLTTDRR